MDIKRKNREIVILILLTALAYFIHKNNLELHDRYTIWRNPPAADIVELADKTGMSDRGRRIFFASVPSIDDADDFNENCSDIETTMIILGCYAGGRIHIFNVIDERIVDAKYVTSAHEMLHAAYARLSKDSRERVNMLLEEAYQYASRNDELRDVMAEYTRMEPEQRYNELHSILGTEYAELFPELENYYTRYFINQRAIADMAVKYRKVFKNLESEQDRLKVQLDRLAAEIDADTSLFNTMFSWLNRDIETFNGKKFHSSLEFNAEREVLLEKEKDINRLKAQIEENIVRYNKWVEEFNNLGGKIGQLNYQLDSKSQAGIRTTP
jgi:hypothetical protein